MKPTPKPQEPSSLDETIHFNVYSTGVDEYIVQGTRPKHTSKTVDNEPIEVSEGRKATVDVYVIGEKYTGQLSLPHGIRCVRVINYDGGGQDITAIAEHHEFHKPRPEMLTDTIKREKGKELNIGYLLY